LFVEVPPELLVKPRAARCRFKVLDTSSMDYMIRRCYPAPRRVAKVLGR
jgi:hypothetical protein